MGRTCGEPDEIKKNTHPKKFTALFREQAPHVGVAVRRAGRGRAPVPLGQHQRRGAHAGPVEGTSAREVYERLSAEAEGSDRKHEPRAGHAPMRTAGGAKVVVEALRQDKENPAAGKAVEGGSRYQLRPKSARPMAPAVPTYGAPERRPSSAVVTRRAAVADAAKAAARWR